MDTKSVKFFSPTSFHHRIGGFGLAKSNSKDLQPCLILTIPCNYSLMRGSKLTPKMEFWKGDILSASKIMQHLLQMGGKINNCLVVH